MSNKLSKAEKADIRRRVETFLNDLLDDNVLKVKVDSFLVDLLGGDEGEEIDKEKVIEELVKNYLK